MDLKNNNVILPFEIEQVDRKLADTLMKYFTGEYTGFVRVGPKGYFLPDQYRDVATDIYNMPIRPTDTFVDSYPRSGTTWTQELVWMVANDLDYEKSDAIPLTERYPFLEFSAFIHPILRKQLQYEQRDNEENLKLLEAIFTPASDQLAEMKGPRFIKTHLPLSLLPPTLLNTARMVYVARDPRDVAVSFYHLNRSIRTQGYIGDFKTYWNFFINDLHHWTPYFDHLKEAWDMRHHPNMLFLFYEDLLTDLPRNIRRIADFFGKQYTDAQVQGLCRHLDIENFKNNKSVNYDVMRQLGLLIAGEQNFIRKGKSGGWRDYFDKEMTEQAEQWIADNLKDTDFKFPHLN